MIKEFVHQFCQAAKAAGIEKLNFYMEERSNRDISVYDETLEYLERSEMSQLFIDVFDLVLQGSDNCSLSDDLIEVLRTVFPIECQISHFLLLR